MHRHLTVVVRDSLAQAGHLTPAGGLRASASNRIGISARSTLNDHLRNDSLTAAELKGIASLLGTTTDALAREAGL